MDISSLVPRYLKTCTFIAASLCAAPLSAAVITHNFSGDLADGSTFTGTVSYDTSSAPVLTEGTGVVQWATTWGFSVNGGIFDAFDVPYGEAGVVDHCRPEAPYYCTSEIMVFQMFDMFGGRAVILALDDAYSTFGTLAAVNSTYSLSSIAPSNISDGFTDVTITSVTFTNTQSSGSNPVPTPTTLVLLMAGAFVNRRSKHRAISGPA